MVYLSCTRPLHGKTPALIKEFAQKCMHAEIWAITIKDTWSQAVFFPQVHSLAKLLFCDNLRNAVTHKALYCPTYSNLQQYEGRMNSNRRWCEQGALITVRSWCFCCTYGLHEITTSCPSCPCIPSAKKPLAYYGIVVKEQHGFSNLWWVWLRLQTAL